MNYIAVYYPRLIYPPHRISETVQTEFSHEGSVTKETALSTLVHACNEPLKTKPNSSLFFSNLSYSLTYKKKD